MCIVLDSRQEEQKRSRLLRSLGDVLRALCARYWIYVVVIMLFVIGITGKRMTIFRIIYMFLFLAFILMFQVRNCQMQIFDVETTFNGRP